VEVLKSELKSDSGNVLEIASGSGQHALAFARAFPNYIFWPSDINLGHLKSIEAWRKVESLENLRPPCKLNVLETDWSIGKLDRPPDALGAIININMVHISPIEAAEGLFRGSSLHLGTTGKLILYGPFKKNGKHTAQSNIEFDDRLRARDPEWGVRDLNELEAFAEIHQLSLDRLVAMPSNNFILVFCRRT